MNYLPEWIRFALIMRPISKGGNWLSVPSHKGIELWQSIPSGQIQTRWAPRFLKLLLRMKPSALLRRLILILQNRLSTDSDADGSNALSVVK